MRVRADRTVPLRTLLVAGLLLVGIALRAGHLSWPPLGEAEADSALGAARSTRFAAALDQDSSPSREPAYASMTALLFAGFGASDALARAVPSVAGISLLGLPLLLRKGLGRAGMTLAMLLLVLSPALVMSSRSAGGDALALAALSYASVLLWRDDLPARDRAAWVAALLALALASGPSALTGLLGIGLGLLLHRLVFRAHAPAWLAIRSLPWSARRELVLALGLVMVFATGGGTQLDGVAGLAASLEAWIGGWLHAGLLGIGPALIGLLVYEPLAFFGTLYSAVGLRREGSVQSGIVAWALGALVVLIAYPGRSVGTLAWCVVPMALLAGQAMEDVVERAARANHRPIVGVLIGLLVVLVTFASLQLSGYGRGIGSGAAMDPSLSLGLAIGALILGMILAALFGFGWSWTVPAAAARVVLTLVFLAQTISSVWRLNFDGLAATARELWRPQAATVETRLLLKTLRGVSIGQTGLADDLPLRLEDRPSAVLAWTLRGFPLDLPQGALASDQPKVILRRVNGEDRPLAADYMGQTFSIGEEKAWGGVLPSGLLRWLVLREAPTRSEQWLLLVRADVASFGELPAEAAPESGG